MGQTCCSTRDRNAKEIGIETRNDKFFMFNYPYLLKEIDKRMAEVEKSTEVISSADLNYFKWALTQLETEIDYNKANLHQESLQRTQKRLLIEICNGDNFIKTQSGGSAKCMIRLEF